MASRIIQRLSVRGLPVVIVGLSVVQCVSYGQEDVDRTVKALEAAFDTWVSKLEFACTFEQSTTTADTFEDALQEKYRSPPQWQLRGEYAMVPGKLIRHAITAVREPPKEVNGRWVGFDVHQYARNVQAGVLLKWIPGRVTFSPARLDPGATGGDLADCNTMAMVLLPLLLRGSPGRYNNPIRLLRDPEVPGKRTWIVERPSRDVIELRVVSGDIKSGRNETRLVFAIKDGMPLIVREELLGLQQDGGRELLSMDLLEDFVAVRGGQMPSKRRSIIRLYHGGVAVKICKSDDLGRRRPQPSDFLVVVPAGDSVFCVRTGSIPSAVAGQRRFDISKMSAKDYDPSCIGGSPEVLASRGGATLSRGSWLSRWWLWIGVGIVVVGLVGYVTYRLRQR